MTSACGSRAGREWKRVLGTGAGKCKQDGPPKQGDQRGPRPGQWRDRACEEEAVQNQEKVSTEVKQGDAEQSTREGAIGPRATPSSFATFLIRDVGSGRPARIWVSGHHHIKGQVMTRGMQGGNVRYAEGPVRKENILFHLGMVLGFTQNAAPHLSQGIMAVLTGSVSTGVDVRGEFAQASRADPARCQRGIPTGLISREDRETQMAAQGQDERSSRKQARGTSRPPGSGPTHLHENTYTHTKEERQGSKTSRDS